MFISIITINYNNLKGLKKTMSSVLKQTYSNFEYIIIDGGSTDGSKAYIERTQQELAYWVSEPDKGIYHAMNKGIVQASGDYLLFLNSGDWLFNDDVLLNVLDEFYDKKDIYYGNIILNDLELGRIIHKPEKNLRFSYFTRKSIPHQSTFINRNLFEKYFLYNEELKIVSDWEFFIIIICKNNATYKYIDVVVAEFGGGGLTSIEKNKIILRKERKESLLKHFPSFFEDYIDYNRIKKSSNLNRTKMLMELEHSKPAQKVITIILLVLLLLFRGKRIKDL